jgi:hypothetical protein
MAVMLTRWPSTAGPGPEPADQGPGSPPLQDAPIYAALVREWARAGRATPRNRREAVTDPERP